MPIYENGIEVGGEDKKVQVSSTDTTTNYLENKLAAGSNVTITKVNPGANEQLSLSAQGGVVSDELVKVSSNDTTAGYLNGKLVAGKNITFTENNDGGNETLTIKTSDFVEIHTSGSDPAVNDDISKGYTVGHVWINTSLNKVFRCLDNTIGAAIWERISRYFATYNIIYVDYQNGNDTTGDGSEHYPYKTINKAISEVGIYPTVIDLSPGEHVLSADLVIAPAQKVTILGKEWDKTSIKRVNGTVLKLTGTGIRAAFRHIEFVCDSSNTAHKILDIDGADGSDIKFHHCAFQDWYLGTQHCDGIRVKDSNGVSFWNSFVFLNGDGKPLVVEGTSWNSSFTYFGSFTGANHACIIKNSAICSFDNSYLYTWEWTALTYSALRHEGTGTVTLNDSDLESTYGNDVCEVTSTGIIEYKSGKVYATTGAREFKTANGSELKMGIVAHNPTKMSMTGTFTRLYPDQIRPITFGISGNPTDNNFVIPGFGPDNGNEIKITLATAKIISQIRIHSRVAPGAGITDTYIIRKNGIATAATPTIVGTATTGTWSGFVSFVAGDEISIQYTTDGASVAADIIISIE